MLYWICELARYALIIGMIPSPFLGRPFVSSRHDWFFDLLLVVWYSAPRGFPISTIAQGTT